MAYMVEDRLKEAAKDANREKALKDETMATTKNKDKATEDAERKEWEVERARALAEQSLAKTGKKLQGMELKLVEAKSLNLVQANEIVELKATLEAVEDKRYNVGFTDAENFVEPIIYQSRRHGFGKGWVAALQVMGVQMIPH